MKKLFKLLMFVFPMAMASHHAFAQEITITLNSGWNWWAPNADMTLEAFETALGNNGVSIISQDGSLATCSGNSWGGDLTALEVGKMYMVQTNAACTINVNGMVVNPPEYPVTVYPGSNWMGFIGTQEMSLDEAMSSFTPTNLDNIKTTNGTAIYYQGRGWKGQISTLVPSQGFVYTSKSSTPQTFIISGVPTITTSQVSGIHTTTATCGGNVTNDGNGTVTARGVCWNTEGNPTINDSHTVDGSGTGSFTSNLTGLTQATTYYVCAYATNELGTAYGEQITFTTLEITLPTVTTQNATNISSTSVTLGGNVTSDGNSTVTERGVCWNTSGTPTTSGSHQAVGSGTGSFSKSITGLTQSTTYYVRAYAKNELGTAYGEEKTFTTKTIVTPTVTTISVYDISPTAAFCGGNVTNNGYGTVTARGVCWSANGTPTISDNHTTNGTGTGSFYSMITGLTPNTTYYVRSYATNEAGTGYGTTRTFTTIEPFDSDVDIVAHRGFWRFSDPSGNTIAIPESAENSIYAAQQAIALDFDGTEFDVQITKDNQLIVFHNNNLSNKPVYNTNLATLQTLPEFTLANGETVPMFTDFLTACKQSLEAQEQRLGERHTKLVLEVKTYTNSSLPDKIKTQVNKIVQYVQQYQLEDDIFFIAFNRQVCEMLTQRMPNVPVAYLSSNASSAPAYSPQVLLNTYGIPHLDYSYGVLQSNPGWFEEAHNLGMTVNAWTVNDKTTTNQMRTLGVDYITTNHPLNMRSWFATEP